MKITCDIIRDLLPLYAEDMVSPDSRKLVDDHLCTCDACTRELAALIKPQRVPPQVETDSLNRVKKIIRRKRILSVLTVMLFLLTLWTGWGSLMRAPIYLTAEQAVKSVKQLEDGSIFIGLRNGYTSTMGTSLDEYDNSCVLVGTNLHNLLFVSEDWVAYEANTEEFKNNVTREQYEYWGGMTTSSPYGKNVWYCNPATGKAETLLWDAGKERPEHTTAYQVNYDLAYCCAGLAAASVLFFLLAKAFRNYWFAEIFVRLSILALSVCVSTAVACAGQLKGLLVEYGSILGNAATLALPMTLTGLFARQLYLLERKEKGL